MQLSIVGTSSIVEQHIKAAKKNNFSLHSISTTRKKVTPNLNKLYKKYFFKNRFVDWKKMYEKTKSEKDMVYLISPRIKDSMKVALFFLKKNKKILLEKPISNNMRDFNSLIKYKKNIFVGYNRVYYGNIKFLKQKKLKNSIIYVTCSEQNKISFLNNSCHIISILKYLYPDLKFIENIKSLNHIFSKLISENKKTIIYLNVVFNYPKIFSIEILNQNKIYELKPIENLKIIKEIKIERKKNKVKPIQKVFYSKEEDTKNNLKPGFNNQWKEFKKFIKSHKTITDIYFARDTIKLALKITSN
jgi:hypothetical protein